MGNAIAGFSPIRPRFEASPSRRGNAGSGERGGTPISVIGKAYGPPPSLLHQNHLSLIRGFIFCPLFWKEHPTERARPQGDIVRRPGIRFSGFEGEGANQGDVARPERSGGRVTTTEKRLIARSRLSSTKEVTGGRQAIIAQESGSSASLRGRGSRLLIRPRTGASKRSEVASGTGLLQGTKPEGR